MKKEIKITAALVAVIILGVINYFLPDNELLVPWDHLEKEKLRKSLFAKSVENPLVDNKILFDSCLFKEVKKIYPRADLYYKNPNKLIVKLEDSIFTMEMKNCLEEVYIKMLKDSLGLQSILEKYPSIQIDTLTHNPQK